MDKMFLRQLLMGSATLLLTACGGESNFHKQFDATPSLWKSYATEVESSVYSLAAAVAVDDAGNTWQSIYNNDGLAFLRKLDGNGDEVWRLPLSSAAGRILLTDSGAILVGGGNLVSAISVDGELLWNSSALAGTGQIWSLRSGSNGRLLLSSIQEDRRKVNAIWLENDGTLARKLSFDSIDSIIAAELVEKASGEAVLLTRTQSDTTSHLTSRLIDTAGNATVEQLVSENAQNGIVKVFVQGNDVSVQTFNALYRLTEDGGLQWQYAPTTFVPGTFSCSLPDADSTACSYIVIATQLKVDSLTAEGTVARSTTLDKLDTPVDFQGDGAGHWLLTEFRAPDEYALDEMLLPENLRPKRFSTYRLHLLNDSGKETQVINLLSARTTPPYSFAGQVIPMIISPDFEYYKGVVLHEDRVIVLGDLLHKNSDSSVHRVGYAAAYSLE